MNEEQDNRFSQEQIDRLLNRQVKKTEKDKELDTLQKSTKMFFGDKERFFFDSVGRELVNEIMLESFILYRIDYKKTQVHKLYAEARRKEYQEPVEVFGRINVESTHPEFYVKGGITRKGHGKLTANIYLSHLEELGVLIRRGDYCYHKGQYYEVTDDGSANTGNKFAFASDKLFFITVVAIRVTSEAFKPR